MFIDEIDKIVTSSDHRYGGDASAEGVQRDLLPIIEGASRHTRWTLAAVVLRWVTGKVPLLTPLPTPPTRPFYQSWYRQHR